MENRTQENRHKNLLTFVKSAFIAYSTFAILLLVVKLFIVKNIKWSHLLIYIALYLSVGISYYLFIHYKLYTKLKSDKNFFVIPSITGLVLGQYYFFILDNARWVYILVLAISYLGITYQNYKTVLIFNITSACLNGLIIVFIHAFKLQNTFLFQDILIVLMHFLLTGFMVPTARFFNNISSNYKNILHTLRDRNHIIENDLTLANIIQKSLLPGEYPKTNHLRFASKYIPMDIIGGDFYDFLEINEHKLGIFISDVSGHGVPAALITSMIKVAVSSVKKANLQSPSLFLKQINSSLLDKTATNFITAFYCIYDQKTKKLLYSNAGHCYPIVYKKKTSEILKLRTKGIVLGAFDDVEFEEISLDIEPGDKLIFYTDGLIESMDKNREMYNMQGLENFIAENNDLPIHALVHRIYEDVCDFKNNDLFDDDVVVIGVEAIEN